MMHDEQGRSNSVLLSTSRTALMHHIAGGKQWNLPLLLLLLWCPSKLSCLEGAHTYDRSGSSWLHGENTLAKKHM